MKKLTLLASLIMATNCFAAKPAMTFHDVPDLLDKYDDIFQAVVSGKDILIVTAIDGCTINGKKVEKPLFLAGIFAPDAIILTNDLSIAASMNHFTTNDGHAPGKPVYQYASYRITSDNMMTVAVEVFDAVYHTPISSKVTYQCKLGEAAGVFAK